MPNPTWGKQFWGNVSQPVMDYGRAVADKVQALADVPDYASTRAAELFPGQPDKQNAMRHSLWMGRMTQEMGSNPVAGMLAKLAGYGFETVTALPPAAAAAAKGNLSRASNILADSRQDLNNNAVGISLAQRTSNPKELEVALQRMANQAVPEDPKFFQGQRPYLTRVAG